VKSLERLISLIDKSTSVDKDLPRIVEEYDKYNKVIRQASKFKAHDEKNESKMGDTVRIMESRRRRNFASSDAPPPAAPACGSK
jgi:hypothetical protein